MKVDTFPIYSLPRAETKGVTAYIPLESDTLFEVDGSGVQLFYYHEQGPYYHPVMMLNRINRLLNGFTMTSDSAYLNLAVVTFDRLIEEATDSLGAVWLTYRFDHYITGEDTVFAPFYSGMAQGLGLSVSAYLYEVTSDSVYLERAESLFRTLEALWGESEPWVVRLDSLGYYWIEEYPLPKPDMTLNGSIIATYGLYDYWRHTGSERALELLRAAFATYAHYASLYRRPGETSYYCLGYKKITNISYHRLHIALFRYLSKVSANPYFAAFADTLKMDAWDES
ncbi:MAG: D-glucuronyl C5-epimerase family protein [Candidatus Zixiibacteriota bacterium]